MKYYEQSKHIVELVVLHKEALMRFHGCDQARSANKLGNTDGLLIY